MFDISHGDKHDNGVSQRLEPSELGGSLCPATATSHTSPRLARWLACTRRRPCVGTGSRTGVVSLQLAKYVGASGLVYAVDRSAEALSYLQGQMRQNAVTTIRCVMTDVLALSLDDKQVSSALLSMMLHHADDPATLINKVAELLPRSAWAVIAEFHPDGPACSGPPRQARLSPGQITQWGQEAGLQVVHYARQSDEHDMLTVHRSPHDKSGYLPPRQGSYSSPPIYRGTL